MTEPNEPPKSDELACPTCRMGLKVGDNCPKHGLPGVTAAQYLAAKKPGTARHENRTLPRTHRKRQDPTTF